MPISGQRPHIAACRSTRLVAAGGANTGTNDDFGLARYTTGGVLDTSFDGDGRQTVPFGSGDDEASAVVVQPDGKIVAAGFSLSGTSYDFAVARLKASGNTDGSFGSGGRTTTDFTSGNDEAFALTLAPAAKLIAAGSTFNGSDLDFALARYDG